MGEHSDLKTMETHLGSDTIPNTPLPTLERQGLKGRPTLSSTEVVSIAETWLSSLAKAATAASSSPSEAASDVLALLNPSDAWWRDLLALTWDMRTFSGSEKIRTFLEACLPKSNIHDVRLRDGCTFYQTPFPDVVWISLIFDFKVREGKQEGVGMGISRLVPVPKAEGQDKELEWKAHTVFTNLESFCAFPEHIGPLRNSQPNHGKWATQREREALFADADADLSAPPRPYLDGSPQVLVIGGGQSGLDIAARLKALGVIALIVEKNARIGDNWRSRYDALCLHDPVWYDHPPYLPFPSTWPVYTPALKLANWLEYYAEALELNVWTSSNITSLSQDTETSKWTAFINKDGVQRRLLVNHVVFCTGSGVGSANTPVYPGRDKFKGEILHSTQHKRALDHTDQKVVVVGACNSAHDIAVDYCEHGVDVTMFQRGSTYVMSTKNGWDILFKGLYSEDGPPVDLADRIVASFPHHMGVGLNQRSARHIANLDKDLLKSLHKVGFRTNLGIHDSGFSLLAWTKGGGYYFDTGASKLIAEGQIKLKSDSVIKSYTSRGLLFENGTELEADVIVWATGLGNPVDAIAHICSSSVSSACKSVWGLNSEGEINGAWRDLGVKGLWFMIGNLALCRFHSSHLGLQIKAIEEGVFGQRYALEK
ncbi:unnamed protein product [Cyclocybe aegerita]|uniref:Flavin-containing monooxygenase n=1 Tax=Cyclocybe aegerita TaxID=1973307 RepID=A0A8S0VUI6_CYCAE|nr:unnamed protein product [Cyclocybe aegerita]